MPFACMVATLVLGLGILIASIIPVSYPESAAWLPTVAGGKSGVARAGLRPALPPEPEMFRSAASPAWSIALGLIRIMLLSTIGVVQGDKFMLKSGLMVNHVLHRG